MLWLVPLHSIHIHFRETFFCFRCDWELILKMSSDYTVKTGFKLMKSHTLENSHWWKCVPYHSYVFFLGFVYQNKTNCWHQMCLKYLKINISDLYLSKAFDLERQLFFSTMLILFSDRNVSSTLNTIMCFSWIISLIRKELWKFMK